MIINTIPQNLDAYQLLECQTTVSWLGAETLTVTSSHAGIVDPNSMPDVS